MNLAVRITLHLLLVILVVLIPPAFYDWASHAGAPTPLLYFGAMTYPLYLGYWARRIRRDRLRIVVRDLIVFLSATMGIMFCEGSLPPPLFVFAPMFALLPCLSMIFYRRRHGPAGYAKTHLYVFLALLPFALAATGLFIFGYALRGAMQGMHD